MIDGDNTYIEIRHSNEADENGSNASQALIWTHNALDVMVVRMKVRIDEQANYQTGSSFTFDICHNNAAGTDVTHSNFARISGQHIDVPGKIEGDASPVITKWTDVEFVFNIHTKTGIYRIGDAEGTFGFESYGQILAIGFLADNNATGLYVDDLQVYTCAPYRINKTVTASVNWDDAHNYDELRPGSVQLTVNGVAAGVNAECNWKAKFSVPAFYADGSEISYTASASAVNGYQNTADGLQVTLTHEPVLPNTNKEGGITTAYFYNDFEGYLGNDGTVLTKPYNNFYTGATVSQAGQMMSIVNGSDSDYLRIHVVDGSGDAYYQADFKEYKGGDLVVHMKLSTDGLVPNGTSFQYRYGSDITSTKMLFKITNGNIGGKTVSSNGWVFVDIVLHMPVDGAEGTYELYVDDVQVVTDSLPAPVDGYKISYMRLYIPSKNNTGAGMLVDDFIIYPGTNRLTVDQVKSPGYYYTGQAYEVSDVAAENAWDRNDAGLDPAVLADAVNEPFTAWPKDRPHSYEAMKSATALYYMVLAEHMTPGVTVNVGGVDKKVADVAAAGIIELVSGGNEPRASAGHYWGHGVVASTMVLAKNTESIWNQVVKAGYEDEVDLLMECLAIAANWGYNTQNDYKTGFGLEFTLEKTANPNIRNAYLTCYLSAAIYFDENGDMNGEELDEIFLAFNYDSYINRLTAAGFTNIKNAWSTVDSEGTSIGYYMENGGSFSAFFGGEEKSAGTGKGVKLAFNYKDEEISDTYYTSADLKEIFINMVKFTYSWAVVSNFNIPADDSYAYISGGLTSAWEGQMGMMREFASGKRSDAFYCYLGAANIAPLYANMKLLGYWDYSNEKLMLQMDNRIYVGTQDLFFKLDNGYHSYTGKQTAFYNENTIVGSGGKYVEDIFNNFHFCGFAQ